MSNQIDADAGIIRGVKVLELGKWATFAGQDGKPKSVKITERHIDALLKHAGNRAVPMHLTHEWYDAQDKANADSVEMNARIGALKAFRKDESGNLVSDVFLKDGPAKTDILFGAEHNPENTMISAVFGYAPNDPECIPHDFRAADIVPRGAGTTALFSDESTESQPMTVQELLALLADPAVRDAITAMIKSVESNETAAADAAEADAGVTDADKKPEDDAAPALMRAAVRISRATLRKGQVSETALLAKATTQAESAFVAKLGTSVTAGGTGFGGVVQHGDEYSAKLAEYRKTAPTDQVAAFRMLKDHPEFLPAHEVATRERMAKLQPV